MEIICEYVVYGLGLILLTESWHLLQVSCRSNYLKLEALRENYKVNLPFKEPVVAFI